LTIVFAGQLLQNARELLNMVNIEFHSYCKTPNTKTGVESKNW
jgi:hypothetical protein